jgi:hypothetical protein
MSEAPPAIASSRIFWMYLTTGASSTSASSSSEAAPCCPVLHVDLEVVEVVRVLERGAGSLQDLVDHGAELVVLDDDRLDRRGWS